MSIQPQYAHSASGEVANFVDDDQFGWGQSVMKCGYEVVSLFWHSTALGQPNPYTAASIHLMAHNDYVHFAGPDIPSDQVGMSNDQLYADLAMHNFRYVKLPLNFDKVRLHLLYGYPVVIGGVLESSIFDLDLAAQVPYTWIQAGKPDFSHIILATGLDAPDVLKFRDTANLDPTGRLRPGPRRYRTTSMRGIATMTALVPTWLPMPPAI